MLSVAEVYRLADAIEPRYGALVLLAYFRQLALGRAGRAAAPQPRPRTTGPCAWWRRCTSSDRLVKGTPKSRGEHPGRSSLPELIVPELRRHLDTFAARRAGRCSCSFGVKGGQLRRSNFSKPWARALAKAGLPAECPRP